MPTYTNPRAHVRVIARRCDVARRYILGETQREIAQVHGVSQGQIHLDLVALREFWLASALQDFGTHVAEELARIDQVEQEAWRGWFRSAEPREVTLTEQAEGGDRVIRGEAHPLSPKRKASVRREGQAGDSSFLALVLTCVERRCALLGLDAPQRFLIDWEHLSDRQLERLAAGDPYEKVLLLTTG